ncbi:LuxR C-terminal-related transcriptional regulator [Streptomyces sp. ME02-8801-2C]|uniref:helix-turn-helix transcriptional regulator n=1 Tax=Streptomyces sp. ME02-8801-2C TaxID=3028680 RepID=UPI0029BF5E18|nr:LuxR C-terminal-related transcriptional regulator [Streptomyces sp. ME02-8801-2C]MDX3450869.1 LuxR C-terminal-related transcriptional regulator [Streptomyces sp. ME02-8801-2C]
MPSQPGALLRPDDGDALRQVLRQVHDSSGIPVLFGGQVENALLRLSQHIGLRTAGLRGLRVRAETGLGGQVLTTGRPAGVTDYRSARSITHDYDRPVLTEGIRSVVAVPVVVSGVVRAVLYGASRGPAPLGDRAADAVADASRRLAAELVIRDEVDHRLRLLEAAQGGPVAGSQGVPLEELRQVHAELRRIAQQVPDGDLRGQLLDAAQRLARPPAADSAPGPRLAPRELDVLTQVALGCNNAEAGRRLSLLPETVKSYLRSAMRKLGASTRFEAVVTARRQGLLP